MLNYGKGEAQMDTKYANAKKLHTTIKYTGTSRKFPISAYLKSLQGVFNDFVDCGKPYTDYKKVLALTNGLLMKDLNPIKLDLLKDPYKNDYEAAIGQFKFMLNHNILDITDGSGGQTQDRGVGALDSTDQKSEWLPQERNKLSKEEKKKRNAIRAKAKSKKDGDKSVAAISTKTQKRQAKKKRKLAKLAKEVPKEAEEMAESDAKRLKGTVPTFRQGTRRRVRLINLVGTPVRLNLPGCLQTRVCRILIDMRRFPPRHVQVWFSCTLFFDRPRRFSQFLPMVRRRMTCLNLIRMRTLVLLEPTLLHCMKPVNR